MAEEQKEATEGWDVLESKAWSPAGQGVLQGQPLWEAYPDGPQLVAVFFSIER